MVNSRIILCWLGLSALSLTPACKSTGDASGGLKQQPVGSSGQEEGSNDLTNFEEFRDKEIERLTNDLFTKNRQAKLFEVQADGSLGRQCGLEVIESSANRSDPYTPINPKLPDSEKRSGIADFVDFYISPPKHTSANGKVSFYINNVFSPIASKEFHPGDENGIRKLKNVTYQGHGALTDRSFAKTLLCPWCKSDYVRFIDTIAFRFDEGQNLQSITVVRKRLEAEPGEKIILSEFTCRQQ